MRVRPASLLAVSLAGACSGGGGGPAPVVALYSADATSDAYPSDHFAQPDPSTPTGVRLSLDAVLAGDPFVQAYPSMLPELDARDGFSTVGGLYVRFSDEIDPSALTSLTPSDFTQPGTPMALVDVDPASPSNGQAVALVPQYFSWNDDPSALTPDYTLIVQPYAPLDPKTRYAFVLSDAVHAASGAPLQATDATRALVSGDAEGDYGSALRSALPAIGQSTGISPDHVVLATMFTTGSVRDDTIAVAKAARAGAPPSGGAAPTVEKQATDPGDNRLRFQGTFPAPEYRAPKPDGQWHDSNGVPAVQSVAQLQYFLAFSDATHSGPRPIVVYAHGLGGDKDATWDIAQYLAPLDVAVIGIDAPEHGSRHDPPYPPGQTDMVVSTMSFIGVDLDARTLDAGIARDNFRQMASDQLELFLFVSTLGSLDVLPEGAPDGIPDVDATKVLYLGESFGAVLGSTALALGPEARAGCLTVGGDNLSLIIRDSPTFHILVKSIEPPGVTQAQLARFASIVQDIVDPGDPINYAPFVTQKALDGVPGWRGTDVLLQEVKDDNIIPNDATSGLARTLGLTQVQPVVYPVTGLSSATAPVSGNGPNGVTAGLFQFDQAGGAPADHRTIIGTPEAMKQYIAFFQSALTSPRAQIVNAY
jgi:hypothetical protein